MNLDEFVHSIRETLLAQTHAQEVIAETQTQILSELQKLNKNLRTLTEAIVLLKPKAGEK